MMHRAQAWYHVVALSRSMASGTPANLGLQPTAAREVASRLG